MKLDVIDLRILDELQKDGSLSNVELAKRVHLSPSPCLARVKALEAAGVIDRYVAIINAAALGLGLTVFISISLRSQSKESLSEFERRVVEHDEVMECYLMTGDSDYLIRVAVADMGALEKFILEQLTPIPGIDKIRSSFALKQVRYKTALPLPRH
ncbi:MAG TPA: Lrp/AsnC family transcriptional regulator [Polaromonas sp.]|uniref:Lrp/AsnC family transcriptional regulator n=1 Tax=Polaromonas sp. TaxID=1869339 RepID=UPI002D28958D|nr:Lrp/AsnC family transcriptional regulator [Polaromonas sp.]HYW56748.1 Lrp/AsnC family transcriptional regulator [Polaromonas sp.]